VTSAVERARDAAARVGRPRALVADYYGSTPARALALVAPYNAKRRGERSDAAALGALVAEAPPEHLSDTQERVLARIASLLDGRRRQRPAVRGDGQRQDGGVHPRVRSVARARRGAVVLVPGDRADAADARRFRERFETASQCCIPR